MADRDEFTEFEPENPMDKWLNKCKKSPYVPIGILGCAGVVGLGAYNYRNRGKMSTSMYLMQLRVASQGTFVGVMCLGLIYSMTNRYLLHKDKTKALDKH